jgi:hypothetical protein
VLLQDGVFDVGFRSFNVRAWPRRSTFLRLHSVRVQLLDFGIAKLITEGEAKESALTQFGGVHSHRITRARSRSAASRLRLRATCIRSAWFCTSC